MNYAHFGLFLLLPLAALAQNLDLRALDGLAAKAKEKAEINLNQAALRAALTALPEERRELASKLAGVEGFTLRNYKFAAAGDFSEADLDPIRKQLAGDASWMKLITVRETKQTVDILMRSGGDGKPVGFLLFVVQPREVTLIHASGAVDLASLQELVTSKVAFQGQAH